MVVKELGSASYFPRVYDYFPRLARGHGTMRRRTRRPDGTYPSTRTNEACLAASCDLIRGKGEKHTDQAKNREEWEENVGIRRTSRSTRRASVGMTAASQTALDPKSLVTTIGG